MASSAEPAGARDAHTGIRGEDWVVVGCAILSFAGILNIIDGALAIGGSHIYAGNAVYVFSDLKTWGWIVLLLGVLELLAAAAIFGGSQLARWFGIVAAGLNALGQLLFVQGYPWWSAAAFAVDVVIIYALVAYAGPRLREH